MLEIIPNVQDQDKALREVLGNASVTELTLKTQLNASLRTIDELHATVEAQQQEIEKLQTANDKKTAKKNDG